MALAQAFIGLRAAATPTLRGLMCKRGRVPPSLFELRLSLNSAVTPPVSRPRGPRRAAAPVAPLGLGIDAGGTQTRWALASPAGEIVAEGQVAGLSAVQMGTRGGQQALREGFAELAGQVLAVGRPGAVRAGLTGFGGASVELCDLIGTPVGVPASRVALSTDLEVAYLDVFEPGEGYLVYAGTGSIGGFLGEDAAFERVGGRGGLLDDGGSGYWIAREALRQIWRAEDEHPGAWRHSPMAREVLEHVGGSDWGHTRRFLYGVDRGEMGRLAMAVAAAAGSDAMALRLLEQAGAELGRLARILVQRFGTRPVALTGRVFQLHPVIEQACRGALPAGIAVQTRVSRGHHAAARLAAAAASSEPQPRPAAPVVSAP
jgi:N-acetylglucosamine kinase-like BadF-type ATPase